MAYILKGSTLTAIADAIRSKAGITGGMTPLQMPEKIAGIQTGGAGGGVPQKGVSVRVRVRGLDGYATPDDFEHYVNISYVTSNGTVMSSSALALSSSAINLPSTTCSLSLIGLWSPLTTKVVRFRGDDETILLDSSVTPDGNSVATLTNDPWAVYFNLASDDIQNNDELEVICTVCDVNWNTSAVTGISNIYGGRIVIPPSTPLNGTANPTCSYITYDFETLYSVFIVKDKTTNTYYRTNQSVVEEYQWIGAVSDEVGIFKVRFTCDLRTAVDSATRTNPNLIFYPVILDNITVTKPAYLQLPIISGGPPS